ncbi:fibronectin type III domain-containing protein [Streptomyces puniciscabiei]|uniref:fibronectin type III domain-containing protein n=1 Tax=Streptomyces puniciscabiei TaxID=164348 RepID=UPI00331EF8EA
MNPARRATATAVVLATAGTLLTAVTTPASATVTCASPVYKRMFYANTTFSGTPRKTDCDTVIDQSWTGAPASGLPRDNFGVRWTVTRDFGSGGPFSFAASGTDGIRVYLDGVRKVDLWSNTSGTRAKTVNVTVPRGRHTLRVDHVNWTGTASVRFGYAPRTSATVDTVKPLVPTGTTVTYDATTGRARISWARNAELDLAGYRVYRRLKGSPYPAEPLATTTTAVTAYTDTTLPKTGATCYYEVRALDKAGNESAGTADQGVTTVDTTAPAAPAGVADNWHMGPTDKVTLYWDENTEPDLAGYRVYRSTGTPVARTEANRVATTPYARLADTLPQTGDWYHYVVTAVDTHGNESAPSGTAAFETRDLTPPAETALNARAAEDEEGVTLTWDASEQHSDDFAGYDVYRSSRPRTESTEVQEIWHGVQGTSFTDRAPKPGATYYYWVVAADRAGVHGTPSQDLEVTVAGNTTAPAAVTGLTATPTENGVALSWEASDAPGFDHYEVLRGTPADGDWAYRAVQDPTTLRAWELTGTTFHHGVPADGEHVRYAVVAVDQYGNRLTPATGAAVADVTELDLRPTAPAATGAPLGNLGGDRTGALTWFLSGDVDPRQVTGFRVYRWNPATAAFDLAGTEPWEHTSDVHWYDRAMPPATTVYYRVTVVYADGTESGASEIALASY